VSLALLAGSTVAAPASVSAYSGENVHNRLGPCSTDGSYQNLYDTFLWAHDQVTTGRRCWHDIVLLYHNYEDRRDYREEVYGWEKTIQTDFHPPGDYVRKTGNVAIYAYFQLCLDPEAGPCTGKFSYGPKRNW
jgi:hypothetical protein